MARLEHHGSVDAGGNPILPVTQLDFDQAMRDFKTMFPMMEEDVIEMVLRANNGAVDMTIDQLLAMSGETEQEKSKSEHHQHSMEHQRQSQYLHQQPIDKYSSSGDETVPDYSNTGFTPPPSYLQAVPTGGRSIETYASSSIDQFAFGGSDHEHSKSLKSKFKWNPPLIGQLPDNFLRIEGYGPRRAPLGFGLQTLSSANLKQRMAENERKRQLSKDIDDTEINQFLEDERIAIFLQNEEFVRELKRNKDFMSTLNMDAQSGERLGGGAGLPEGPSVPCHEDDAAFKEKLRNMGKASKRKFAQFAKLFSRRRVSLPHLLGSHGDSSNSGRENLFSEDTYTQLENEGSDTESINRTYFETYPDEEEQRKYSNTNEQQRNLSRHS